MKLVFLLQLLSPSVTLACWPCLRIEEPPVIPLTQCEITLESVYSWVDGSLLPETIISRHMALQSELQSFGKLLRNSGGFIGYESFVRASLMSPLLLNDIPYTAFFVCETNPDFIGRRYRPNTDTDITPWDNGRPGFRDDAFQLLEIVAEHLFPGRIAQAMQSLTIAGKRRVKQFGLLFAPTGTSIGGDTRPNTPEEPIVEPMRFYRLEALLAYVRAIPSPSATVDWPFIIAGLADIQHYE